MNLIVARCDYVNWFKVTNVCLLLASTELRYLCVRARVCARACARARVCVCVCVCVEKLKNAAVGGFL
jgi:hypothetical protein